MALLEITNISGERVYLADLYTDIAVGKSKSLERSATDLPRMRSLQTAMAAGLVTLSVQYSAEEVASGLHAPPSTIEAVDLAPVLFSSPASGVVSFYASLPPGISGSPDDVEIFPVGSLPFKCRVLDLILYVSSSPGASTVQLRDEAGGAGTLLASADSGSIGRQPNTEKATTVATPSPSKGLFARRSDDRVGGEVVLLVRPEL